MLFVNDALPARAGVTTADPSAVDGVAAAARKIHGAEPGCSGSPTAGWRARRCRDRSDIHAAILDSFRRGTAV